MQIDASLIHRYIIINSGLLTKQNKAVVGSFLVPKLWTFSDKFIGLFSLLQALELYGLFLYTRVVICCGAVGDMHFFFCEMNPLDNVMNS